MARAVRRARRRAQQDHARERDALVPLRSVRAPPAGAVHRRRAARRGRRATTCRSARWTRAASQTAGDAARSASSRRGRPREHGRHRARGELRRRQHQQLSRAQILDAAEAVFARKGFHDATVKEIAAAAEFSVGGVYSFFADKDDLFVQIYLRRGSEFMAGMRAVLDEPGLAARRAAPPRRLPGRVLPRPRQLRAAVPARVGRDARRARLEDRPGRRRELHRGDEPPVEAVPRRPGRGRAARRRSRGAGDAVQRACCRRTSRRTRWSSTAGGRDASACRSPSSTRSSTAPSRAGQRQLPRPEPGARGGDTRSRGAGSSSRLVLPQRRAPRPRPARRSATRRGSPASRSTVDRPAAACPTRSRSTT